jgi:hypothetical protein
MHTVVAGCATLHRNARTPKSYLRKRKATVLIAWKENNKMQSHLWHVSEFTFPVNRKHFPIKEKFDLIFKKIFSLLALFVFQKVVFKKPLSKLSCICLPLEKLVNEKHFSVKGKFGLVFRKVFS